MSKDLKNDDLAEMLTKFVKLLQKNGLLKGLDDKQIKDLVNNVIEQLNDQRCDISFESFKRNDKAMVKFLTNLLVHTAALQDPKFQAQFGLKPLDLKLILPEEKEGKEKKLDQEDKKLLKKQMELIFAAAIFQLQKDLVLKPGTRVKLGEEKKLDQKQAPDEKQQEVDQILIEDKNGNILAALPKEFASEKIAETIESVLLTTHEEEIEKKWEESGLIKDTVREQKKQTTEIKPAEASKGLFDIMLEEVSDLTQQVGKQLGKTENKPTPLQ